MNAYCRKGPGTDYYAITFLTAATDYDVIGQNGLNTWWLVQAEKDVTCWVGDPSSVMLGPVWNVPITSYPALPKMPAGFTGTRTCDPAHNILTVGFYWNHQDDAVGFHLYRNGDLIKDFAPTAINYTDSNPPFNVDLHYELRAFNDFGESLPAVVSFVFCS